MTAYKQLKPISVVLSAYVQIVFFSSSIPIRQQAIEANMTIFNDDKGTPEPILFLELAQDHMIEYKNTNGTFAEEWHQLGFPFTFGFYQKDDPSVYPTVKDGNRWHPKKCNYTYVIIRSNPDSFLIRAFNEHNVAEYELTRDTKEPKHISTEDQLKQAYIILDQQSSEIDNLKKRIRSLEDKH